MKAEQINNILHISESFRLPETLMSILLDDNRRADIFDKFMNIGEPLDHGRYFE